MQKHTNASLAISVLYFQAGIEFEFEKYKEQEKNPYKLWNKIICFIKCFDELKKVNRQANIKHQEEEELDTKYLIYKVCVYLCVCIHTCTFSIEIWKVLYVRPKH